MHDHTYSSFIRGMDRWNLVTGQFNFGVDCELLACMLAGRGGQGWMAFCVQNTKSKCRLWNWRFPRPWSKPRCLQLTWRVYHQKWNGSLRHNASSCASRFGHEPLPNINCRLSGSSPEQTYGRRTRRRELKHLDVEDCWDSSRHACFDCEHWSMSVWSMSVRMLISRKLRAAKFSEHSYSHVHMSLIGDRDA